MVAASLFRRLSVCVVLLSIGGLSSCNSLAQRIPGQFSAEGWLPPPTRAASEPVSGSQAKDLQDPYSVSEEDASLPPQHEGLPESEGDARQAGGEKGTPIDLEAALTRASSKGLLIEIARQRAAGAAAEEEQLLARFVPTVGPRYEYFRHSGQIQSTEGLFLDVYKQNTFAGAAVKLELEPVSDWYEARAARWRTEARIHEVQDASHATIREAASRYFELVLTHAEIDIAQRSIAHAREILSIAEARERQGVGLRSDVLRAQARLAETESQLTRAEGAAVIASAGLVEILLLDAATVLIPAEENAPPFEVAEATRPFAELLERARATRPDLAAAKAELGARQKQLSAAKSWGFPGVLAEGRIGGFGEDPSSLKDQQALFLSIGWDFGPGITGRYHRARAAVQEARFQQQLLERRIATEIAYALQGIRTMQSMLEAARRAAEASREGLELARSRFQAGESLLLEVVDMQAVLARAELRAIRAAIEHKRMQLDLLYSIGGPRK